jgi:hypothetical protein
MKLKTSRKVRIDLLIGLAGGCGWLGAEFLRCNFR